MHLTEEQEKVKALLVEAMTVLCKNGITYRSEFSIEGLLGITVDNEEVFLINVNQIVKGEESHLVPGPAVSAEKTRTGPGSPSKSWRGGRRGRPPSHPGSSPGMDRQQQSALKRTGAGDTNSEPPAKRLTTSVGHEEGDEQSVTIVKNEPNQSDDDVTEVEETSHGSTGAIPPSASPSRPLTKPALTVSKLLIIFHVFFLR